MRIIRGKPANGKPRKIKCTGCGKRAVEAGIAVPDDCIEQGYGADGPVQIAIFEEGQDQPLCESCVEALLSGRDTL